MFYDLLNKITDSIIYYRCTKRRIKILDQVNPRPGSTNLATRELRQYISIHNFHFLMLYGIPVLSKGKSIDFN